MKRFTFYILLSIAVALSACNFAYAQSRTNRIFRPCPSSTTPASVSISTAGAITLAPCSGQTVSLPAGTTFGGTTPTAGSVLFAGSSGEIAQDNSNLFWNNTDKYLMVGHTSRAALSSHIEVNREGSSPVFTAAAYSNSSYGFFSGARFRGTRAAPSAVLTNDTLAAFSGRAYHGTGLSANIVGMWLNASEDHSSTARGTYINYFVTANGSVAPQERLRLYHAGLNLASTLPLGWSSSSTAPATIDTGLARLSAGVISAIDGSTAVRGLIGGGAAVASAAALPLPTGRVFHVTGTTNITSITSTNFAAGVCITLIFDDVLTFTDGNNLAIAGNFVTTANDTISLCYDGTNWFETGRSVN